MRELFDYYLPVNMYQDSSKKVLDVLLKQMLDKKLSSDGKYLMAENL